MTEVRFIGPEYDGIEQELGNLTNKLRNVADNAALAKYGKDYLPTPTDIEVLPSTNADMTGATFIVRAWHETAGMNDHSGIFQLHDTSFSVVVDGEDAFMLTEKEVLLPLTSRELLLLLALGDAALIKTLLSTIPPDELREFIDE